MNEMNGWEQDRMEEEMDERGNGKDNACWRNHSPEAVGVKVTIFSRIVVFAAPEIRPRSVTVVVTRPSS